MAERVSFTPASAGRIAAVVRAVENARPSGSAAAFRRLLTERRPAGFRVATYTGSWSIGGVKTVTFKYKDTTPNTASVTNLFFPIGNAMAERDCAIAREGTSWFLIDVPFRTATAVFITATSQGTFVTNITLSGSINTANCSVTIGRTLTTGQYTIATATATATYVRFE